MPDITIPNTLTDGNTILASEHNQNYAAITAVVNGNIDDDNIAAGAAIAASKLAIANILTTASTVTIGVGTTGDASPRIALDSDGHLVLGSGSAAGDVRIKRESAGVAAIRNAADSAYEDLKVDNLIPATALASNYGGTGLTNSSLSGNAGQSLVVNGAGNGWELGSAGSAQVGVFQARLTLETGVAISTTDQTAKTTIYLTKYNGNQIGIWNGSSTTVMTLNSGEVNASLAGLTANLPYDVFCYDSDSGGDVDALELVAWTNTTTRTTALLQIADGYYVKTGDTGKRYCGTILITATTGQCEDSTKFRGVFNHHNRVRRPIKAVDTTNTWTYATAAFRPFNNSTTLGVGAVRIMAGMANTFIDIAAHGGTSAYPSTNPGAVGIGINSTSADSSIIRISDAQDAGGGANAYSSAYYKGFLGAQSNSVYPLEYTVSGTRTWAGDNGLTTFQSGLIGEVIL